MVIPHGMSGVTRIGVQSGVHMTSSLGMTQKKTIIFKTAWCGVLDLMLEVSRNFPECTFCYRYASEDTGSCTGEYELKNGVATLTNEPENGTKKAYELAFELTRASSEYYELVNGEYVCKDDDGDSKQGYILRS